MDKQYKILIGLLVVAISAVLYLIISSSPVEEKIVVEKEDVIEEIPSVDLVELEKDYKEDIKVVFNDYSSLLSDENLDILWLEETKNKLLALKVPTEYKDLHFDLVFSIVKMGNYLENGDKKEKEDSDDLIEDIKNSYNWLIS